MGRVQLVGRKYFPGFQKRRLNKQQREEHHHISARCQIRWVTPDVNPSPWWKYLISGHMFLVVDSQ